MFIIPLYQQHASHTLASQASGPQPHMRSSSATGPYIYTDSCFMIYPGLSAEESESVRQQLGKSDWPSPVAGQIRHRRRDQHSNACVEHLSWLSVWHRGQAPAACGAGRLRHRGERNAGCVLDRLPGPDRPLPVSLQPTVAPHSGTPPAGRSPRYVPAVLLLSPHRYIPAVLLLSPLGLQPHCAGRR